MISLITLAFVYCFPACVSIYAFTYWLDKVLYYLMKSPSFKCSIRLTTYDMVKRLIVTSQKEFQRIVEENCSKQQQKAS